MSDAKLLSKASTDARVGKMEKPTQCCEQTEQLRGEKLEKQKVELDGVGKQKVD